MFQFVSRRGRMFGALEHANGEPLRRGLRRECDTPQDEAAPNLAAPPRIQRFERC